MTFYELLKRVYWALDEWIASSLGLGDYYGADEDDEDVDDTSDKNEDDEVADEDDEVQVDEEVVDEDDGYDDMYKYHDHQA
jgi:hypothetical protein